MMDRLDVRKTYKLYIGGAFPRSESGRSYPVSTTDRRFVANAVLASRKDVRDAVKIAFTAGDGKLTLRKFEAGKSSAARVIPISTGLAGTPGVGDSSLIIAGEDGKLQRPDQ